MGEQMTNFHEGSYRSGFMVGLILGAVEHGCRNVAASWPEEASEEHKQALLKWGEIYGLRVVFDGRSVLVEERKPPRLEVVK